MSTKKREYISEARQASAGLTKNRILTAAKELFKEKGFDKATISGVAGRAGVSIPSVYALYKSKEGLLREIMNSISFGDEYQALVNKILTETDPVESLRIAASITRVVCEAEKAGMGFIRGADVVSPELKALAQEGEQIRYDGQELLVIRLFDADIVNPEIDFAGARDILWSLTSRELYRMMVIERNWPPETYEKWLADTLIKVLIKVAS